MNISKNLPITPLHSKAARYQLGYTQANVIEESGIPGHKLKGFEAGRLIPDMKFLEALASFYTDKGIALSDLKDGDGLTPATASAVVTKPGADKTQTVSSMALRIAIPADQIDPVLERMESIDDRVEAILKEPANTGFLSGYDEATEARQRELFGLMAGGYLLFRHLQGRPLLSAVAKLSEKKTQGEILSAWVKTAELDTLLGEEGSAETDHATEGSEA